MDVHRTGDCLVGYCERCGCEVRERRDPPRERWTAEERARRLALINGEPEKPPEKPEKPERNGKGEKKKKG
jgi:hypothetical protein